MKLEKLGISRTTLFLAIEFAIYGFLFYYFAPLSFYLNRIDLFLMMLNLTLLAMVLGMTVMANQLQGYFERFLVNVCLLFTCKNRSLKVVIEKNLESHQKRNHKTALMITMSVCFIIFSGSGITMNAKGLVNQLIMTQGGDLVIFRNTRSGPFAYDYEKIDGFLREYKSNFTDQIREWCWSTKSFTSFQNMGSSRLSALSLFPVQSILVTGVDKTVMDSVRQNLYIPFEYQDGLEYKKLDDGITLDGVSSIFLDNED